MKISLSIVMLSSLCAPLGCVASAQAPASQQGFEAYRMVEMRNIFDPERLPVSTAAGAQPQVAEPPPKGADYVMLTGVMVNGGKALAFFYGSRPDYDKVTEVNGEIAGAKVTKITPDGVEVDRAGNKIKVAVGLTVPFDNSAPQAGPVPPDTSALNSAPASAPGTAVTGTGTAPSLPGNLNDVMRRMMERRQQELQ